MGAQRTSGAPALLSLCDRGHTTNARSYLRWSADSHRRIGPMRPRRSLPRPSGRGPPAAGGILHAEVMRVRKLLFPVLICMSVLVPAAYAATGPSSLSFETTASATSPKPGGDDRRPNDIRAEARAQQRDATRRAKAKVAPKVAPVPAVSAGDRRMRVARRPPRHRRRRGIPRQVPVLLRHLGRGGRHGRSRRGSRGRAGHARGDALRAQRPGPVARLRPVPAGVSRE